MAISFSDLGGGGGGGVEIEKSVEFLSSGTWTKPEGVRSFRVEGISGTHYQPSYGCAAGGYFNQLIEAPSDETLYSFTVGASGGSGRAGNTVFDKSLIAESPVFVQNQVQANTGKASKLLRSFASVSEIPIAQSGASLSPGTFSAPGYANGYYFSIGDNNNSVYLRIESLDAVSSGKVENWTTITSLPSLGMFREDRSWTRAAFGNGVYVVGPYTDNYGNRPRYIARSTDRVNWSLVEIPDYSNWTSTASVSSYDIKFLNGQFVIGMSKGNASPQHIAYSTNGSSWSLSPSIGGSSNYYAFCGMGYEPTTGRYVALVKQSSGDAARVYYTTNLANAWTYAGFTVPHSNSNASYVMEWDSDLARFVATSARTGQQYDFAASFNSTQLFNSVNMGNSGSFWYARDVIYIRSLKGFYWFEDRNWSGSGWATRFHSFVTNTTSTLASGTSGTQGTAGGNASHLVFHDPEAASFVLERTIAQFSKTVNHGIRVASGYSGATCGIASPPIYSGTNPIGGGIGIGAWGWGGAQNFFSVDDIYSPGWGSYINGKQSGSNGAIRITWKELA